MILGQSAATAAAFAIDDQVAVQKVNYEKLRARLLADKQILEWKGAASVPGGSITGAPKIRAMELVEGLEPVRRGPYTGTLCWIGADGAMGSSILIRTFVADGERLLLGVGGGITRRSDPEGEWEETVAKAAGPLGALGGREVGS